MDSSVTTSDPSPRITALPSRETVERIKVGLARLSRRFLDELRTPNAVQILGTGNSKSCHLQSIRRAIFGSRRAWLLPCLHLEELETESFEQSHLLEKLRSLVLVARHFDTDGERMSIVVCAQPYDLKDSADYDQVREDYEEARWVLRITALNGCVERSVS